MKTNKDALNGLTKREYFAALALPGIFHYYTRSELVPISTEQAAIVARQSAMIARQVADALIKELKSPSNEEE